MRLAYQLQAISEGQQTIVSLLAEDSYPVFLEPCELSDGTSEDLSRDLPASIRRAVNGAVSGTSLLLRSADGKVVPTCFRVDGQGRLGNPRVLPLRSQSGVLSGEVETTPELLAEAVLDVWELLNLSRLKLLFELAQLGFEPPEERIPAILGELRSLFEAEVATLLLEQGGKLALSGSTDSKLHDRQDVSYEPGEGLTGFVFQSGENLRIADTEDQEAIEQRTGLRGYQPTHADRDGAGELTCRFLGVPMKHQNRTLGVLRLARTRQQLPFSYEDQLALRQFCTLWGNELVHSWELLLASSIRQSKAEIVVVSRRGAKDSDEIAAAPVVQVNRGAIEAFGGIEPELLKLDARDFYAPGEFERIHRHLRAARKLARETGSALEPTTQAYARRRDGSVFPVDIAFHLVRDDRLRSATLYTIAFARDVSERLHHEEGLTHFRELLNDLEIVFYRADAQGLNLEVSPVEARFTGYSEAELRAINRTQLYFDARERGRLLDHARQAGGKLVGLRQKLKRKDGVPFWAEGDLRIRKDAEGNEIEIEGFYRDVTSRLDLQKQLGLAAEEPVSEQELLRQLQSYAEGQIDFQRSLSHQLQSPLTNVHGLLLNIRDGVQGKVSIQERLRYAAAQVLVAIDQVKNLSYLDRILREEKLDAVEVSLRKLAVETAEEFELLAQEKKISLAVVRETLRPRREIVAHRGMLRQVFVNLLDNAVKYSLPGTRVFIRGREWPASFELQFLSRGLPVPKDMRERIFERTFRAPAAQRVVPAGTGLGLWLVRKILAAHGATIHCTEVYEQGESYNLFRIYFPMRLEEARRRL